jgi:hypothetical protein
MFDDEPFYPSRYRGQCITLLKKGGKKKGRITYILPNSEFFSGSKIHQNVKNNNKLMPGPRTIRAKMLPAQ